MPERDYEVIIDAYVYPDTVTITLANDRFIGSRDYVSKELHESVSAANHALQAENAKLRELASEAWELLTCNEPVFVWSGLQEKARELGIEVEE